MTLLASGFSFVWLLAQDPGGAANSLSMVFPIAMIGILFFFMVLRPQQREQRKRDELLKAIKKNDRVLTTGGIFGVVTNVQSEANEVTIRVDEKNDTKLRLQLSSIARVLAEGDASDSKTEVNKN
ncbi:MAG: preprotein translocase subunit YajC [Planctomycetia bacterium]|nr:preprotein translocase subunit YajC [Planctomycetia bacterium]